jgi:hypothetical protein
MRNLIEIVRSSNSLNRNICLSLQIRAPKKKKGGGGGDSGKDAGELSNDIINIFKDKKDEVIILILKYFILQ